jgi:ubiquinone/menaquinone biosynthesis C-methylase UbiE
MENKNYYGERVFREKSWHNQSHGSNVRASTKKFYSIINKNKVIDSYKESIIENLNPENTVLLDYGCGYGDSLICLASNIKRGVGIDISNARIENAKIVVKDKGIENIEFFVMDAMNTSFNNNEFDIIKGLSILHHLDLDKSLKEMKRILKNDGKAYFIEPLATNPIIQLYRYFTPKKRTEDEQPLRKKDIKLIKSIFLNTKIEYCNCFTLLAVPFRNSKKFEKILTIFEYIDKIILNNRSPFKWLAWECLLTLDK